MIVWVLVALNVIEVAGIGVIYGRLRAAVAAVHTELRPNHGASSRDVLNRLEFASEKATLAADAARVASDTLTSTVAIAAELALQNRAQLHRLSGQVSDVATAAATVADDLVASHIRADEVDGVPGAAADAASQSPRTK